VDIKNEENGAKTTKLRLIEGVRTKLQRTLKNQCLTERNLTLRKGIFVKSEKYRGFLQKRKGLPGLIGIDPADSI
jgi:hypothetical protein